MPLYEYQCKKCSQRFELLVRADQTPACPGCQGEELEKLLSVFAVGAAAQPARADTPCGRACGNPAGPGGCHAGELS